MIDASLYSQLNAFEFIQIMTLSVLAWEIISTMPMELALYRRGFKSTFLLLSISRYFTLACVIIDVALNAAQGVSVNFCNNVHWVLPFLSSLIQFVSMPLLLLRTYAVWGRDKSILMLLIIFWIAPLVIGIYVCTTYSGVPYSLIVGIEVVGGCGIDPLNNVIASAPFIANLIVDSCVLFLTIGRIMYIKNGSQASSVSRLLIRDGLLYYIVVVLINIINLIFFLAPGILPLIRALIATPATVAPAIMVGRLFFNLQNSFLSVDSGSLGSEGSSYNRHRVRVADNSRALYPLQPLQVAYTVNASKHTDDSDHTIKSSGDVPHDLKSQHMSEFP